MPENIDEEALLRPYARGYRKYCMILDLADGVLSQERIAEKYGITQVAVSKFAGRNADAIDAARKKLEDGVAQYWIAKKEARMAVYQGSVEHLSDLAELVEDEKVPGVYRVMYTGLRNAAEELGHLSPKEVPVSGQLTVRLEGVDTEAI